MLSYQLILISNTYPKWIFPLGDFFQNPYYLCNITWSVKTMHILHLLLIASALSLRHQLLLSPERSSLITSFLNQGPYNFAYFLSLISEKPPIIITFQFIQDGLMMPFSSSVLPCKKSMTVSKYIHPMFEIIILLNYSNRD